MKIERKLKRIDQIVKMSHNNNSPTYEALNHIDNILEKMITSSPTGTEEYKNAEDKLKRIKKIMKLYQYDNVGMCSSITKIEKILTEAPTNSLPNKSSIIEVTKKFKELYIDTKVKELILSDKEGNKKQIDVDNIGFNYDENLNNVKMFRIGYTINANTLNNKKMKEIDNILQANSYVLSTKFTLQYYDAKDKLDRIQTIVTRWHIDQLDNTAVDKIKMILTEAQKYKTVDKEIEVNNVEFNEKMVKPLINDVKFSNEPLDMQQSSIYEELNDIFNSLTPIIKDIIHQHNNKYEGRIRLKKEQIATLSSLFN